MKLLRLKTADELEREYARRLQRCTLHNHVMLIGVVILMSILLWASFQGPTGTVEAPDEWFGPDTHSI